MFLTFKQLSVALITHSTLFMVEVFEGSPFAGADVADDFSTTSTMVSLPSNLERRVAELQHRNRMRSRPQRYEEFHSGTVRYFCKIPVYRYFSVRY